MEFPTKVFILFVIFGFIGSSLARVYIFDDGQPDFGAKRSRRQILIDRPLPEHVFAQLNTPLLEAELYQSPSRQVETRAPRDSGRWDLGFDASEILSPPELQTSESRYRTMKSYRRRVPEVRVPPGVVWGSAKQGAVIERPHRATVEGNGGVNGRYFPHTKRQTRYKESEEEDESEEQEEEVEEDKSAEAGYNPEGHSYHHVPASIYSFVKTDPHGNFKWGVHEGPPVGY